MIAGTTPLFVFFLFANFSAIGRQESIKVARPGFLDIGEEMVDYCVSGLADIETFNTSLNENGYRANFETNAKT